MLQWELEELSLRLSLHDISLSRIGYYILYTDCSLMRMHYKNTCSVGKYGRLPRLRGQRSEWCYV